MAITQETLRLVAEMRATVEGRTAAVTRELVAAWADAWDVLRTEWEQAVQDLAAQSVDGRWPGRGVVLRAERAQRALETTAKLLGELSDAIPSTSAGHLASVVNDAQDWQARIMGSQYPEQAPLDARSGAVFNRVDPAALAEIVTRTTEQITSLAWSISAEATAAIQVELIRGIAVGDNPRVTARRMLARVEGRFNGGLARALNIARTEMLDAHRAATNAAHRANAAVLTERQWVATLDRRTCPSCLAKHGTRWPVDSAGPEDHQQGRCVFVPVTKSWRDLGFDVEEPPSALPDARKWFDSQPESTQIAILGPSRLALLLSGSVSWEELSTLRSTPGWRNSWVPAPVRTLTR